MSTSVGSIERISTARRRLCGSGKNLRISSCIAASVMVLATRLAAATERYWPFGALALVLGHDAV